MNENTILTQGCNQKIDLAEVVMLNYHPFFIGAQFHPELQSTVENLHPLFIEFMAAAMKYQKEKKNKANLEAGLN